MITNNTLTMNTYEHIKRAEDALHEAVEHLHKAQVTKDKLLHMVIFEQLQSAILLRDRLNAVRKASEIIDQQTEDGQ